METSLEKIERSYIKLTVGLFCGVIVFGFLCWGGWRFYSDWQSKHLVRRANAFLSGGDIKAAMLSARRAFQQDDTNVAAARLLGEISEKANDRQAVDWRRRVVELEPNSADDAVALVDSALQFGDLATAEKTVVQLAGTAGTTAAYHAAAAEVAQAHKNNAEAIAHLDEAVRLAPNDQSFRLKLAAALLASADSAKQRRGRELMESLRHDEKLGRAATRALLLEGVQHGRDPGGLLSLAKDLVAFPDASFTDRMLQLETLREANDPEFSVLLTKLEREAPSQPTELATLLSWMNRNRLSLLALDFAKGLSPEIRQKWPIPAALAESHARLGEWPAIEQLVQGDDWGDFEFLRHAWLSRAWREEGKTAAARGEWAEAIKIASEQGEALSALMQLIANWGWDSEMTEVLWASTKFPDKKVEALHGLYLHYLDLKDTPGLYRVLSRLAEVESSDPDVKNNLAQIALLLNVETGFAQKLADEVYRAQPGNPNYVTTYAYAMFAQGKVKEAIQAMRTLSERQLQEPAIAAYYGIFLADSPERAKALPYLEKALGAKLLPEEQSLVDQAMRRLQRAASPPPPGA